jgi:hypothetical protein
MSELEKSKSYCRKMQNENRRLRARRAGKWRTPQLTTLPFGFLLDA